LKPKEKKLIIRVHRFDAFSWCGHLVDWSKVDGLVFVSKSIQSVFWEIHGLKVIDIPYVIARNAEVTKLEINVPTVKTLGLLQYNKGVKDPMFALELLKYFREQDSEWRLLVAGPDWDTNQSNSLRIQFFEFIEKNSLKDSVLIEGYQEDPSAWYKKIGFMLSASVSEGSHEVIRESILAGSVPLIRNWPAIKEFGGAYGAYPELSAFIFDTTIRAYEIANSNLSRKEDIIYFEDKDMQLRNVEILLDDKTFEVS
jgi:hypothetical protein